jgi:hypothetical protein
MTNLAILVPGAAVEAGMLRFTSHFMILSTPPLTHGGCSRRESATDHPQYNLAL